MKRGGVVGIAVGFVAVIALWYLFVFSPTSSDLDETREQVASEERRTLDLEATVRRLEELRATAPQQEATLRALNAAVPATPDLADFILQANDIAAASGIDWLSISPSPPSAGAAGEPSSIALSIQIQGGFFELLDYLNRLEDLERLVVVDAIDIGAASEAGGASGGTTGGTGAAGDAAAADAGSLSISITGRMFTRAAPAGGTAGASPTGTIGEPTPPTTTAASVNGGNS